MVSSGGGGGKPTNGSTNSTSTGEVNSFQNLMMFLCITALFGALVQGVAPKKLLKNVPQPIVIMVFYMIAGIIFKVARPAEVEEGVRAFVDPVAIQALFLPVLMFSELFRLNTRAFYIVLYQLLMLVGPGVVIGALLTAVFPYAMMPSRPFFDFNLSMAFGGMLATTDPIAIIICVNELSAPKRLAALVGGESLLNDGTSIVLVSLFLQLRKGGDIDAGQVVFFAFNQLVFSILFGTAMGILALLFIRVVRDDSSTLTTFVVTVPFLTYIVAAYYFGSSGVLAIIPLGVILNDFGRGMMMEVSWFFFEIGDGGFSSQLTTNNFLARRTHRTTL
jgi:NhaP-type Na+/H+ or K+/H+ antiporter